MAAATTKVKILSGYTGPIGNRAVTVADITLVSPGNAGTYPAGGFPLAAGGSNSTGLASGGFGLRGFDCAISGGMVSQGGNYTAVIQNKNASPSAGGNPQTMYLRLIVLATGLEVATNAGVTADVIRVAFLGG